MPRVSSIFDHDPVGEESRSGNGFVWFLPLLCFGGSVLFEKVLAFFMAGDAGAVAAVLVFTVSMLFSLITALNGDNVGGAGKVLFAFYSLLGWLSGSVALFVFNALFNHQAVT